MTDELPPLQGGMTNDELRAAWKRKLPTTEPTDNQLSCFAIGVEVGYAIVTAAAVAREREACAALCDDHASIEGIAQRCAAAIRAR